MTYTMTNKELQIAIESILAHLRVGPVGYTSDSIAQLKALYAIQLQRASVVREDIIQ
jgi:hypothetical protein